MVSTAAMLRPCLSVEWHAACVPYYDYTLDNRLHIEYRTSPIFAGTIADSIVLGASFFVLLTFLFCAIVYVFHSKHGFILREIFNA